MKPYELLYIIPNKFTDAETEKIMNGLTQYLTENESAIIKVQNYGKRKLAYPIKHFFHGYYILVHFDAPPQHIPQITQKLKLNQDLLRHIIIERPNIEIPATLSQETVWQSEAAERDNLKENQPEPFKSASAEKERIPSKENSKPEKSKKAESPAETKEPIKDEYRKEELDQKLNAIFKDEDIKV
ncbi:MAG: 30S ribosomal protein S6 [Parcubacteria group bacterium]|nr:30S ribosomal protein S6 [Parcubacteria group bacterium]